MVIGIVGVVQNGLAMLLMTIIFGSLTQYVKEIYGELCGEFVQNIGVKTIEM